MDDEYELIPKSKIDELKHEVENYKNPSDQKDVKYDSVKKIDEKLDLLIDIFKGAKNEAKNLDIDEKIESVDKKLDHIEEELKKVTQALVVLARMIKNPHENQSNQNNNNNTQNQNSLENQMGNQTPNNQQNTINSPPNSNLNQTMPPPPPPIRPNGIFGKK